MYSKEITYKDYNDIKRTEKFYFNLSRVEVLELEAATPGGLKQFLENMAETKDNHKLIEFIKELIRLSYGVKSPDGKYFRKSEEIWEEFRYSEAFVELFLSLGEDSRAASEFVNGIIPQEILNTETPENAAKLTLME